jgi:hypothetical protein
MSASLVMPMPLRPDLEDEMATKEPGSTFSSMRSTMNAALVTAVVRRRTPRSDGVSVGRVEGWS